MGIDNKFLQELSKALSIYTPILAHSLVRPNNLHNNILTLTIMKYLPFQQSYGNHFHKL